MSARRTMLGSLAVLALAACHRGIGPGALRPTADDSVATRPLASRAELEAAQSRLTGEAQAVVRARLADGDFRPGDRVLIAVQGDTMLSDTFAVWPDLALHLPSPTVGSLPLRGVLRSELEGKVQSYVGRFLRTPVVRAHALLRLSVQGEVVRAGFHAVPADAVLSDALTAAGGTTVNANMSKVKLERDGHDVMEGRVFERAIASGRTLDQAGVREGDQIIVPKNAVGIEENLRFVWLVLSVALGAYTLTKVI